MSKVLSRVEQRYLAHIVLCGNKFYYIDSAYTLDHRLETMVFKCSDKHAKKIDFSGLYAEKHMALFEMVAKHNYIINHLEDFINEDLKDEN